MSREKCFGTFAVIVWLGFLLIWIYELTGLVNPVPFCDDFGAILNFLISWKEQADPALLFEKYQEGRVFLSRLLVALYVNASGYPVVFSQIPVLIWLAPIALSFGFVGVLKEKTSHAWELALLLGLPIAAIIFQISVFGMYLWPQSGLTHGYLVPLGLFSLWSLEQKKIFLSLCLLFLALFSAGGGVVLFLVWLYFFYSLKQNQHKV